MTEKTCSTANRIIRCSLAAFVIAMSVGCSPDNSQRQVEEPLTDSEALIASGKKRARACTGCHGPNGISRIPSNPSLAGRSPQYLSEQLQAFREGRRNNPTMSSIARNLTDADVAALSHYFASLPAPPDGSD